ncbi:MAG: hypothetical protein ABI763_07710 [Bacteroidota bacterium]
MNTKSFLKDTGKISKASTIIIFLALIRCISEPFRLQYYTSTALTLEEMKPFLIGALVTSIALFCMTILSFYRKEKIIISIGVLTIVILLMVKSIYLIP